MWDNDQTSSKIAITFSSVTLEKYVLKIEELHKEVISMVKGRDPLLKEIGFFS